MRQFLGFLRIAGLLMVIVCLCRAADATFPLHVSSNGRYLVGQNGVPFQIRGDSGWEASNNLTSAEQATYLSDRIARGFNAVLQEAVEHKFTIRKPPLDVANNLPFTKRLDATTFTGSPNGCTSANGNMSQFGADPYANINTQSPDFTCVNEAFWARLDSYVTLCSQNGVIVLLWPSYVGWGGGDEGWMGEMVANDAIIGAGEFAGQSWADNNRSKMWNYGAWIANRYKNYTNIIWIHGGDYGNNPGSGGVFTAAQKNAVNNLFAGLKSVAGQQSILNSAHWSRGSLATDISFSAGSFDLESTYADTSPAQWGRSGYAHTPAAPAFMIEGYYENNSNAGTPLRRLNWWALLSNLGGYFYGNESVWAFGSNWQSNLDSSGAQDMARMNAFIASIAWQNLVPSGLNGMKNLITTGGGTANPQSSDYVAAAAAPDGTLLVAYVPPAHGGTITVDMTAFSGSTLARWFNPTTAVYTTIGTFLNTGTQVFTPPGNNGSGFSDWLLVATASTNAPPTVQTAAAASPNPVSGTTTALSVLGADDGGEPALTYTWATTGTPPAAVTFSANGTNAAKSATATFSKAGSYTLQATIRDAGNLTATSNVAVTVNQTLTAIAVAPTSATVTPSGTQQFTATGSDQFNQAMVTQPAFTWTVSGGGTISSSTGLFTAGVTAGGPFTVTAASGGRSGTANVSVSATVPVFTTQPAPQTVTAPSTVTFSVVASGTPTPTYQWQSATSGSSTFSAIGGATSTSYTTGATSTTMSGTQYRCVATNSAGAAMSTVATLTVNAATVAPAITTQPANQTVTAPAAATFSLVATGSPTPTYQWQSAPSGSSSFTAIGGATSTSYTTVGTTTGMSGTQYRCVATNSAGSATSTIATLSVNMIGSDTVWVEDSVPAGGIQGADGGDAWTWVAGNSFSGLLYQESAIAAGMHQHYFTDATQTLTIGVGDTLFAYVYLDPANLPTEVMLQWNNGTWEHRAYWGANALAYGTDGTTSRRNIGALPSAGQWARLEVPASVVGLEGSVLTGMAFTLNDGRAWFDKAGKGVSAAPAGTLAFSAATYSQAEGNSGTSTVTITATRSGGSSGAVGVSYATANGTATSGSDYTAASGTLSWATGDAAAKNFTVTITGDATFESDETVLLSLSSPTGGATLGTSSATLTITNDDIATVAPAFTTQPANQTVTAPATATFSVVATGTPTPTYQWQSAPSGSSSFTAIGGATSASYTTGATSTAMSGTQYRCVATNSAGSATSTVATLTVTGSTATPTVSVAVGDAVISETGPNPGTFIITLSNTAAAPVTVKYAITGRARNGVDYTTLPVTATVPAGQTTATVTVTPIDDTKYEKAESVTLTLSSGTGYTVGAPTNATLSIQDNDGLNQTAATVSTSAAPTAGSDVIYTAPTNAEWTTDLNSTWVWGDGSATVTVTGAVSATHAFATAGTYAVTVTITDPVSLATVSEAFSVTVAAAGSGNGGGGGGGGGGCGGGSGLSLLIALMGFVIPFARHRDGASRS